MSAGAKEVIGLKVKAFARPEDISSDNAYHCSPWTLYATGAILRVGPEDLRGCCHVTLTDDLLPGLC